MIFPAPRHARSGGQTITPGKDGLAERIPMDDVFDALEANLRQAKAIGPSGGA